VRPNLPKISHFRLLSARAGRYTSNSVRSSVDNGGGDTNECYDVPPRAIPVIPSPASSPSPAPSCYDIPRPPTSCTPNSNCSAGSGITPLDCYDVPRPLQPLTPSSSASSLTNDGSLSGSNRYVYLSPRISAMRYIIRMDSPEQQQRALHRPNSRCGIGADSASRKLLRIQKRGRMLSQNNSGTRLLREFCER